MKLMWLGYLVYSLGNCVIKLYIETGLTTHTRLRMATGRVWTGWSLRAPKTETRSQNPKPVRVEIQHQNQTRKYLKLEQIPETRMVI